MKLDFSVLEEVRKELETWQDITSRPILGKIRNLDKKQSEALSLLCSFNACATFEQIWWFEYIFHGESSWKREEIESSLKHFLNESIVKEENELISFLGDEFDKIYIKYLLREKGIAINFLNLPIELQWQVKLSELIKDNLGERVVELIMTSPSQSTFVLDVLKMIGDQSSDADVFVKASPFAEELYKLMINYQDIKSIPIFSAKLILPWLNTYCCYRILSPKDLKASETGIELINSLRERIELLGGNLTVETSEIPIVSLEILTDKVLQTANIQCRLSLINFHQQTMFRVYLKYQYKLAAFHANLVYMYDKQPDIRTSNNIAYILLSVNEFDEAELLLQRAISLSQTANSEGASYPGLPIYNLGVLRAEQGKLEEALNEFRLCISLTLNSSIENREISCLWVPVIRDDNLIFEERRDIDLMQTAEEAKMTIESILTNEREV